MKKSLALARVNLQSARLTYLIFLATVAGTALSIPINILLTTTPGNYQVSVGSYAFMLPLLFAVFTPALHFRRFMNLDVKKIDYIRGSAISYVAISLFASLFNTLFYLLLDNAFSSPPYVYIWNLMDVFGWARQGVLVAFVQQFAFLLLVCAVAHTLTTIQTFWYGWVVDAILAAILSVFIPIAPLRGILMWVFNLLIFTPNAPLQIAVCLAAATLVYAASIPPIKQKPV